LLSAFVGLAILSETSVEAKGKTPYWRRLRKTFELLPIWANEHIDQHPHNTEIRADKDNKTKFNFKFDKITDKIYKMYNDRITEIAQGCPDTSTCQEYLDCSGEGDRMNTVRGRPAVELSDAYMEFVMDKWARSKGRIFDNDCGFPKRMVSNLDEKFGDMVAAFKGWRLQCRRFSSDNCPAHCQVVTNNSGESKCTLK